MKEKRGQPKNTHLGGVGSALHVALRLTVAALHEAEVEARVRGVGAGANATPCPVAQGV